MLSAIERASIEIGRVIGMDSDGRPMVRAANGSNSAPLRAWLGIDLDEAECEKLANEGERVLMVRSEELGGDYVIVGVLRERPRPARQMPRELVLEAAERLVVQCGTARIVLHGDGRYELHAERISQRSRGVHTIKGAAVRIN